jgi:AAA15 family ATPase/GTPase
MELKFIWVDNFRILKNIGINFNHSDEHKFEYTNDEIKIIPNRKSVLDFGKNITGVTAIAGQNGSGKSSICEIVLNTTATYVNGAIGYNIEFNGIVCYGDHIFYQKNILINNKEELTTLKYVLEPFDKSPFESMSLKFKNFIKNGFIYYSNVIDWRSGMDFMNLANISTENLIEEDRLYSTYYSFEDRFNRNLPEYFKYKDKLSQTELFLNGEGYRISKFYVNFKDFLPFRIQSPLILKSTYSGNNKYLNTHQFEDEEVKKFIALENSIFDKICDKDVLYVDGDVIETPKEILKNCICQLYRYNLLMAISINSKTLHEFGLFEKFVFENADANIIFKDYDSINRLVKVHSGLVKNGDLPEGYSPSYLKARYETRNSWRFYAIESLYIQTTEGNVELLKEFMLLEEKVLRGDKATLDRVSNYSILSNLSSGEYSFLSFFSRLYDVINKYDLGIDDRNKLILFIDEAEIGFHPEWKRKFLKWLLDFLNTNFAQYRFQLIFMTHSPYLLSDLESSNVLLLKKNENSRTELLSQNTFKTFGANIHELLTDSFFLNEGFIGEFAKKELNALFHFFVAKTPENEKFNKVKTKELIEIIAEPIIKSQLSQLFDARYNDSLEIDFIDEEIKRLQKLKTDKQNDSNRT